LGERHGGTKTLVEGGFGVGRQGGYTLRRFAGVFAGKGDPATLAVCWGGMLPMSNDFLDWLDRHQGTAQQLHAQHLNPAFVKMLRAIGFDKSYVRGQGCYLWDEQGNQYLDLLTGWGVFVLGRNHPRVRAILQQVLGADLPNLVRMDCSLLSGLAAQALVRHTEPDLSRVYFCNSGTEAVETAIKFARCAAERNDIVFCEHAFHGLTTGSLAVNGADFFRDRFGRRWRDEMSPRLSSSRCRARAAKQSRMDTWPRPSGFATSTARC
jgi:4-aminobutyrate aminotransferase-like enzyme